MGEWTGLRFPGPATVTVTHMAFHHTVLFKWADDVDAAYIDKVTAALNELPGKIPEIKRYSVGPNAGVGGNFDYGVIGEFDDVDGFIVYRDHPAHQELIQSVLLGKMVDRAAVQFES